MSIREQLLNGTFEAVTTQAEQITVTNDIEVPEGNFFFLKDRTRGLRMEKSQRAREHRKMLRQIKTSRHQLGFHEKPSLKY